MPWYVVDTGSLIDLVRRYPRAVFPGLWKKIDTLVAEGRMLAPWQVYKEIEQKHDTLFTWARGHMDMFRENTAQIAKFAAALARDYHRMSGRHAGVERADPYVAASTCYACSGTQSKKPPLVTGEGARAGRIFHIARLHGLAHIGLVDMMVKEKWSFD